MGAVAEREVTASQDRGSLVKMVMTLLDHWKLSTEDQAALLGWLSHFTRAPQRTFVVHGEATASESFAAAIHEKLGWSGVDLPTQHSSVIL